MAETGAASVAVESTLPMEHPQPAEAAGEVVPALEQPQTAAEAAGEFVPALEHVQPSEPAVVMPPPVTPALEQAPPVDFRASPGEEIVREVPQSTAPVTEQAAPSGTSPRFSLQLDWPADLVQIETDPGKVQRVEPQEEESPRPRRTRRPAPPPVSDEPLVQVETRRRDATLESQPL